MSKARQTLITWLPALAYMALSWVLSSIPNVTLPEEIPFHDKGAHFVEYGVLAVLLAHSIRRTWTALPVWLLYAATTLSAVLWGLSDEIHQAFVPGRSSDPMDVLADGIGGCAGALVYVIASSSLRHFARARAKSEN